MSKSKGTMELLGCSIIEYRDFLEDLFRDGMSWDNYGDKNLESCWEIDHIRPIARFDIVDKEQQVVAFNWRNTEPLWR